jgi:cyclophilin family peptidyl-prolyl cis-trans isomerase
MSRQTYGGPPPELDIDPQRRHLARLLTDSGEITLALEAEKAPRTVNNFIFLARQGLYDGVVLQRVIEGFMAQSGDSTGSGRGGPGYVFEDEFHPDLRHDRPGVLSMANRGPDTNGSQFFITLGPRPWLDDKHTVFGRVTRGMDVLRSIPPRDPNDRGSPAVSIRGIEIQGLWV